MLWAGILPSIITGFSPHPRQLTHIPVRRAVTYAQLEAKLGDDNNNPIESKQNGSGVEEDSFDGGGFANYLGPYAIAFVGSIAVTAAFFKFVLMNY